MGSRLFAALLSWLNDHESDAFFVGTSNDVSRLPPELTRAERFDGVFFLDLPGRGEKDAIWAMYLARFALDPAQRRPQDRDWTGAEIKSCCRLAALLEVPLLDAARNVVPVATTAGETVERLRAGPRGAASTPTGRASTRGRGRRPIAPAAPSAGPTPRPTESPPARSPRRSASLAPIRTIRPIPPDGIWRMVRVCATPQDPNPHPETAPMSLGLALDLDRPDDGPTDESSTPADRLRAAMAACRVQFTWLGTQKALSRAQRATAAEPFDAEGSSLSAAKKLLDTAHPAYRAVTAVRTKVVDRWRAHVAAVPRARHPPAAARRRRAVRRRHGGPPRRAGPGRRGLDRDYAELRAAAASRLGSLFDPLDYPEGLVGLFDVAWDFPSVEPPVYLMQLAPAVYAEERARVAARFAEAARLAEAAFVEEFARLVDHLAGRLEGTDEDG